MANKQQTSVEWLWNELDAILPYSLDTETGIKLYRAKNQALQMNQEQIEQAFIKGNEFVPKWKINGVPYIESEQYYEQTYGTTKSH